MTVQTRAEQEIDENGDLHRVQHLRKAVHEARPAEVQTNIVNEFNNARNIAAASIKAREQGSTSSSSNTVDQQPPETPVCQAGRHRSVALATERTIPSRQIHAAVTRVNNEKYTYPLPWGSHQNAMNAILEQRRRFATRQWLSGNTSAAAAATTAPPRTAEVETSHATDGDSDDEIPVEACRIFKGILNAAQEQNQKMLEEVRRLKAQSEPAPLATLHEEQQQALEEARMFHMLREYEASRLRKRMLPEDYAKFIHKTVQEGYHETTVKIKSRQLGIMAKVHKEIHRVHAYRIALQHAYEEDEESGHTPVAHMTVKAAAPSAPATTVAPSTQTTAPAKTYVQPQPIHGSTMDWTFAEGEQPPLNGNKKFPTGALKGKTWLNVTLDEPEHFFSVQGREKNPKYLVDYITWVKQYYDVDIVNKRLTRSVAQGSTAATSVPPPVACSHAKTTKKGSSARYVRISCADCGAILSRTPSATYQRNQYIRVSTSGPTIAVPTNMC